MGGFAGRIEMPEKKKTFVSWREKKKEKKRDLIMTKTKKPDADKTRLNTTEIAPIHPP